MLFCTQALNATFFDKFRLLPKGRHSETTNVFAIEDTHAQAVQTEPFAQRHTFG